MERANSLLNNTFIYAIGNFGSKVLSYAMVPLFSFFVNKKDLGLYDLFLTSISLLFPVVTLQLSEAMYRWLLTSENLRDKRKVISTGIFSSLILLTIFGLCYLISTYFYSFRYQEYFYLLLIGASLFPIAQQIIRGLGKNKLYSFIGLLNSVLLVFFNLLFLYFLNYGLLGILLASILSYSLSVIACVFLGEIYTYIEFRSYTLKHLFELLKYSTPLIPNAISWWLINAANRFLILHLMGIEANGDFAISSRFPAILAIINSIFMLAWQDIAISKINDNEDVSFVSKLFNQFLILEICLTILLIPISKFLVSYVVESSYQDTWKYMPLLFLGTAFSSFSAFYGSIYLKEKRTINLFTTTIIGGIVNLGITYLLIPLIGLFAPGVGTLLGFATVFILRVVDLKSYLFLDIKWFKLISLTVISILLFLLALKDLFSIHILIFAIGLVLFVSLNNKLFKYFKSFLISKFKFLN
ncbi:MAG: polysaccharide biosynthesis C-terminal domain-containing protein [Nonlabens ulvanivorans]|uniref:lipopolysaccharide biosynthesis protein n=1 Tax=Nonlabens ulvanivorans TaxID=906888 RepID=UPI0032648DB3